METIKITVLNYYNRPVYYPFMDQKLFDILEQAFLEDKITVEVPKYLLDQMIKKLNDSER